MPKNKKDQEITERVQGKDKDKEFAEAAKEMSKNFDISNQRTRKTMTEAITDKLSDGAKSTFDSLKALSRPGGMIKSVGLLSGSPGLMMLGDSLNKGIDSAKANSLEAKQKQEEMIISLEDQGLDSEQIKEVLKMNGRSEEDIANKLAEMNVTLGSPDTDFTAEEIANDQVKRDEQQLTFLQKMVESLNGFGDKMKDLGGGNNGFLDFLAMAGVGAAVILAPFVAMGGFFTGLMDSWKMLKLPTFSKILDPIRNFITKIKSLSMFTSIGDEATKLGKFLLKIKSYFSSLVSTFKNSTRMFAKILKTAFGIGKFFGKLMPFIQILSGIFYTISGAIDGFKEEGIIGAIKGGIKGLLNGLVFSLLDMVKDGVSWIAGKFGFDNFASILDSFSFVEIFNGFIDSVFNGIQGVITYIKDLFTFPETFGEGLAKLTDLIYAPLNLAINFLKGMFKWGDPEEPFKLSSFITGIVDSVISYVTDLFKWEHEGEEWSLTTLLTDAMNKVWTSLKNIMDFDFWSLIPKPLAKMLGHGGSKVETLEKDGYFTDDLGNNTLNTDKVKEGLKSGKITNDDLQTLKAEANLDGDSSDELEKLLKSSAPPSKQSTPQSDSSKQAMDHFMSKKGGGFTKEQASGLVGNLQAESGKNLDTTATGDGGKAKGIAQWHPDRQAEFTKFSGKDIGDSSLQDQLDFTTHELTNGNEKRAGLKLRESKTPEESAIAVDKYYERSSGEHRDKRIQNAKQLSLNETISPITPKPELKLSSQSETRPIKALEREGQTTKSGSGNTENNNNTSINNSTVNNIPSNDMSVDSPDRSLTYAT